ncbi:MAG TPA: preprotein translocase subunit SecG [candidate division Zixibacteria bacterium]|nr:preprotein translocase subunit SecG [candidate division Zixibacteria bacterium]
MLFTVVVLFHVIVAIALVLVVLLQSSKGEALSGAAFGGGGGGASFGPTRGSALSKATTVLAIIFMFNCVVLTWLSAQSSQVGADGLDPDARSVVSEQLQKELEEQQAAQGQQPAGEGGEQPVDLDSLIKVQQTSDTAVADSQ